MTTSKVSAPDIADRVRLVALLLIAYALRIWLATGGGQRFWPDESRYGSSQLAAASIRQGRWHEAMAQLFGHADHVLFRVVGLPIAIIEDFLGSPRPILVSAYFALFSVGTIFLIWAVARKARASSAEALWAAFFAATSNCLFFYSDHCLPYDASLCVILIALWYALGPSSAVNSVRVGAIVALGFLIYNGYWLLGASCLLIHTLFGDRTRCGLVKRGAFAALGLLGVIVVVVALGEWMSAGLITSYWNFSATVKQGNFNIGYRVIAEFLWYSERGLLLIWLAAIGFALAGAKRADESRRLWMWLTGVAVVLGGLIFFSDVITRFMVYGRLTRGAVPYICLAAGLGMTRLIDRLDNRRNEIAIWLAAVVTLLAAFNFWTPLVQEFPDSFNAKATSVIADQRRQGMGFFRVLFAESLWGKRLDIKLPAHMELMRSPHPMQFRPFQYEGFSAENRASINGNDVAMQLIEFPFQPTGASREWGKYPGPVRMKVLFQPEYWAEAEPLVSTGMKGQGDLVMVTFIDPEHLSFGLNHGSHGGPVSQPIEVDYSKPHELIVSAGSLLPPSGSEIYRKSPELEALLHRVVIFLDGHVVLSQASEFCPSTPDEIDWGVNGIGALVAQPLMRSSLYEFGAAPMDTVATAIPELAAFKLAERRSPEWKGMLGPVRMSFTMAPPSASISGEPLLSINGPHTKDVVFLQRSGPDMVKIGFDRKGAGAIMSKPLRLSSTGTQELDVSLGSLLPDTSSSLYTKFPGFEGLRRKVYLRFNGIPVVVAEMSFSPASPLWVTPGLNTIGSSTYSDSFRGTISDFTTIGPERIPGFGTRLTDLLQNPNSDPAWAGYSGPFRIRVVFPAGRAGHIEPLLASGTSTSSNILFVEYQKGNRVRFGCARSGVSPLFSASVKYDPAQSQELLLSSPVLMPPESAALYANAPEFDAFRWFVHVGINGETVFHEYASAQAAAPDTVFVGVNQFRDTPVDAEFHGKVEAASSINAMDLFEQSSLSKSLSREGWNGYPGPLRIVMKFPAGNPGEGQPIVTTGLHGIGDVLYLRYESNGLARIAQDHWGAPLLLSEPFPLNTEASHTLIVSLGSFYPPSISGAPEGIVASLRNKTVVLFDGRALLSSFEVSHPSTPGHITVGINQIGGTTAQSIFSGTIDDIQDAPLAEMAR